MQEQLPRDAANESTGMYLRRARHRVWCWQPLRLIENLTLLSFCQCGGERPDPIFFRFFMTLAFLLIRPVVIPMP